MCKIFNISPIGYYSWCKPVPSKRALEEKRLELEIIAAHKRTRETFGPERLQDNLSRDGVEFSVHRRKRIRKKLGIV